MRLIISLGNPGEKNTNNRHNVGHLVVDGLRTTDYGKNLIVRKTDTFMNDSGEFVKKLVDQYKLNLADLWIVHDDLDIPLGSYKIQFGKGPKDHNGLNDIYEKLGSRDFWHVRIGVDPTSRDAMRGEEIVLADFTSEERKILDKAIKEVCKKLGTL